MNQKISPKYQMKLVKDVAEAIWAEYQSYKDVHFYISKWRDDEGAWHNNYENISIEEKEKGKIDLESTLQTADGETLLKIAIDIGVETPDFIPSIPTFRNELKTSYETAYATFERAFKSIEDHPNIAIGLANSALESIIKEILKDDRINSKITERETLYKLTENVLKEFQMFPNADLPIEIRSIGSSLLKLSQQIEKLRSTKTEFHGKTETDYIIKNPLYAFVVINSVATVGLFLNSYYKNKYPKINESLSTNNNPFEDDLPF